MSPPSTATADGGALPAPEPQRRAATNERRQRRAATADTEAPAQSRSASRGAVAEIPRVDLVIEALIYLFVAYLPLAFGGVMPASQIVIIAASSLIAAIFAVRCVSEPEAPVILSWIFLPLFGVVGVVLFQLVPLPAGILAFLSPSAADAWAQLAAARGVEFDGGTLSLYPRATRADLTVLLSGVILVVVGATIFRRRASFRRLLAAVALVAFAVATIGLAQILAGADRIYWYFEGPGLTTSGPFAHYGHYSEFLNLGIGCALGYLLLRTASRGNSSIVEIRALVEPRGAGFTLERVLLIFCVVGAIAIVMSTSRNGLISMIVGAGLSAALMHGSRRVDGIGWPMVIAALVALVGLLSLGIDPVIRRFEDTFADPTDAFSTRTDLLRDTLAMVAAFPLVGAGLGAYGVAFPAFDTAMRGGTAEHAENQYIEVFAELGLVGGLFAFTFVIWVLASMVRAMFNSSQRTSFGLFGLAFAFGAVAFHSLTDFGMEIPAVGLTVAMLCGAAIARSHGTSSRTPKVRHITATLSAATGIALVTGLSPAFAAVDAHQASRVAENIRADLRETGNQGTAEQHQDLLAAAISAADSDPRNVELRSWAAFARWNEAVARHRGFDHTAPPATPETAPELRDLARVTVEELLDAARLAPTHGSTWTVAGQIQSIWLTDDPEAQAGDTPPIDPSASGGDWILHGRALAPHVPTNCLAAAFEYFRRGEDEQGMAELERAIAVGASDRSIVDLLAVDLDVPERALPFVDGNLKLTDRLHGRIKDNAEHAELAVTLQEAIHRLLIAACARASVPSHYLAHLAGIERDAGNLDAARALYRRHLGEDPISVHRYDYARLLESDGAKSDARRELRDLLTYHPGHQRAKSLLAQLESGSHR